MISAKEINFMSPGHSDTNRGKRMKIIIITLYKKATISLILMTSQSTAADLNIWNYMWEEILYVKTTPHTLFNHLCAEGKKVGASLRVKDETSH